MKTLLVAIIVLVPALVRADGEGGLPTNDKAKAKFLSGLEAYKANDFDTAIKDFAAGYAAEPWPGFLFAWAQAERQREHCPEAIALYERFLATDPPAEPAQLAKDAMAACGTAPKPPPPKPIVRRERVPGFHHKLALGLTSSGVLLGGASLACYLLGRRDERLSMRSPTLPDAESRYERAQDLLVASPVFGGLAAALVIAGGIRFAVHGPEYREVVITPNGVTLGGTF